ncbi:MAG: metallophosphoesterase, partial [Deltaproteobacteria bacterium]|nr:metallophosphoesterase [Deltaproteobacteria bacterium]
DLCTPQLLRFAIRSLCGTYPQVVYVTGNHEYYHSHPADVHRDLRALCAELPNFSWMQNDLVEVAGLRVAGTTLWFRDEAANRDFESRMSDFALIQGFKPWVYDENERALEFLKAEAPHADVVVTHHLPSWLSVTERFTEDPLNRFFVCEIDDLIERAQPPLWIHGHTHESIDTRVGETRILCNPCGYTPDRNPDFQPKLVIRAESG